MLLICSVRFVKGGDPSKGNESNQLINEPQTINSCLAISNWLQAFLMACLTDHMSV